MLQQMSLYSMRLVYLGVCLGLVLAAPAAVSKKAKEQPSNLLDSNYRYMSKKWYEEGDEDNNNRLLPFAQQSALQLSEPVPIPTGFGFGYGLGEAAPFFPDKWSDLFLAQHERSFLPSVYGSSLGVEKRRRPSDDKQQQFLDNYYNNLVEPGRFEWNFNRL